MNESVNELVSEVNLNVELIELALQNAKNAFSALTEIVNSEISTPET